MAAMDYTSPLWRRARAQALARDGSRCQARERYGPVRLTCGDSVGVHVHHIVRPEDGGDPFAVANLIVLCPMHHRRLHGLAALPADDRRRRARANAAAYRRFAT